MMWRNPGLWLIRCPRCHIWHWWKTHTVRDCYTRRRATPEEMGLK